MAQRPSPGKRLREAAKQEKAKAKRDRRAERMAEEVDESGAPAAGVEDPADVMAKLQALHQRYDDGSIEFDDFEAEKQALLDRLG